MNVVNVLLIDNNTLGAGEHTFEGVELTHMIYYDIIARITGTCAGSIKLQKCDDPDDVVRLEDEVWFDIPSSSQNFTNATDLNWTATDVGFRLIRAVVTVSSGSAVTSMRLNAKGFI